MTIKILFYGSCWPTNIGNAFVNLGAIHSLKAALGERADVFHFGGLSSFLFRQNNRIRNNLDIAEVTRFDYVVQAGMTQAVDHLQVSEPILRSFIQTGARVVIAGGGASRYDDDEVQSVREWMKRIPIYAFVSRDRHSYENYGDLATPSFDGIDSAFFIAESFTPIPLDVQPFDVLTFDSMEEPQCVNGRENQGAKVVAHTAPSNSSEGIIKRVCAAKRRLFQRGAPSFLGTAVVSSIDLEGRLAFRTHHAPWHSTLSATDFERPNTLISDLPSDYLSLYAQAHNVYSDRVHACIATLAFGNRAKLFGKNNPRLRMFERVGAGDIIWKPVRLNLECLRADMEKQMEFWRKVLV
jgi:hypothetical protein